jgi:hypothetical protein
MFQKQRGLVESDDMKRGRNRLEEFSGWGWGDIIPIDAKNIDTAISISENGKHLKNFNTLSLVPEACDTFLQFLCKQQFTGFQFQ